jgi:hypothetical protein
VTGAEEPRLLRTVSVAHLVSLEEDVDPLTGQPAMSALDVSLTRPLSSPPPREQEISP